MSAPQKILRIDASARRQDSITRTLSDETIDHLTKQGPVTVTVRDLADGLPLVSERWIGANFTDPEARTPAQNTELEFSDSLVAELKDSDTLVIGLPIYNFGVPAALKAWIDLVARARVTFKYTEAGPVGLLENKRAIILVASGGTKVGSDIDFATSYLRHALKFIGITDVQIIAADQLAMQAEASLKAARHDIAQLGAIHAGA